MITIERLRVRCRASEPRVGRSVLDRLQRIATTSLPEALDRRAPDLDLDVGSLEVRLDFDPRDYDDETVAILWADRIVGTAGRAAARGLAHQGAPRPPGASPGVDSDAVEPDRARRGAPVGGIDSAVLARLRATQQHDGDLTRRSGSDREAWARSVVSVVPRDVVLAWAGPVSAGERLTLASLDVSSLARWLVTHPGVLDRIATSIAALEPMDPTEPRLGDAGHSKVQAAGVRRWRAGRPAASDRDPVGAERTSVGGVVLLYPWMSSFVRRLADATGVRDDIARLAGMAVLAGDLAMTDDPLVRSLSAVDDEIDVQPELATELDRLGLLGDDVYERFASVLPGFESSTRRFLQRELIERTGTVQTDGERIVVGVASRPLDVVLDRLPFPRAVFRLPWTGTVVVEWERS